MDTSKTDHLTSLAVRMKKGDRRAASTICDELLPKAYGFFFTRTGGRREVAEDLAQESLMRFVSHIDGFDEKKGNFTVWFWRIARNALIDHYREKSSILFGGLDEDAVAGLAVGDDPDLDLKMAGEKLMRFVDALDAEERELFELRFVAELSYAEIAELVGRSEGSLRVAALRVKEKIKKKAKFSE